MNYNQFKSIFNEAIFDKSKADLLEKVAHNPSRYIGLFRPTKPKAKILQNLLQSHEIRFGDAFEDAIKEYIQLEGCENLQRRYTLASGDVLDVDQCFAKDNKIYFIEQKVRDDHDSTKKRGQVDNFERKLEHLQSVYCEKEVVGIMFFIDPELNKNKNYYSSKLQEMGADYGAETQLFYGEPLFEYLGFKGVWQEILSHLRRWRKEIPDMPEINFDLDAQQTFEEIKDLKTSTYRKLLENDELFSEIILTIFPQQTVLRMLLEHFETKTTKIYATLAKKLRDRL